MSSLLEAAEALECQAAEGRVAYFSALLQRRRQRASALLDVGCGNGYGVARWRERGQRAFGVDRSLYRMGRWASEHGRAPRLVVADAARLPFASSSFDAVVSSGMIEHVGVSEASNPYTVEPHAARDQLRGEVIADLGRVVRLGGVVFVDCPNGSFPIDFWHGDRLGAFRLHRVPDALLPGHRQLLRWGSAAGLRPRLQPLGGRLRFQQIRARWWGRLLGPVVEAVLKALDPLVETRFGPMIVGCYPYVVVSFDKPPAGLGPGRPAQAATAIGW
jgi:SAM-dependent methyltransferase